MDWLQYAIDTYKPRHIIALFSGGHDSLVATHYVVTRLKEALIGHLNTGIGIEDTRVFVKETCQEWGRELLEYKAAEYVGSDGIPDPQVYEEMVLEYGFPGEAQHSMMYARLKERPLRMMLRDLERSSHDKTLLITGVRQQESQRRMRHVEQIQIWEGTKIWVAPIWNFSGDDVNRYIQEHNLRRNQVSDLLHGSKECLCGAFAHKGELDEISLWYPDMGRYLRSLQARVMQKFPWGWEESPPDWYKEWKTGQSFMPGFEPEFVLCSSCPHR